MFSDFPLACMIRRCVYIYDHFGACADTHPIVVVPAENIICKVEEDDEQPK